MNDPLLVRGFEGLGDLLRDGQGLIDRDRSLCDPIRERRSLDQFHHEGLHTVGVFQAVDRGDIWVVQGCEDLGLPLKAGKPVGIGGE